MIVRNVQVVHVVMTIVLRDVVVRLLVVLQVVAGLLIAMIVQGVRDAMMTVQVVDAALTIVRLVRKLTHSVVPIKFVHARVVVATIVMRHRAMITRLSAGKMKDQLVHRVVYLVVAITPRRFVWSATKNAHRHQLLLT